MKRVFYNTGLVLILMGVFAIPLMGFGFITQGSDFVTDVSNPNVLGASTGIKPSNKKFNSANVVAQLEYTVITTKDETENVLYDVVPAEYLSYRNFIVSIPNEYKDQGIEANLIDNKTSVDLVVNTQGTVKNLEIPATILILN